MVANCEVFMIIIILIFPNLWEYPEVYISVILEVMDFQKSKNYGYMDIGITDILHCLHLVVYLHICPCVMGKFH